MSTAHSIETLSATPVNPEVNTSLFEASSASYYVGILATRDMVLLPAEYQAALKLRANVYIDEFGFLPEEVRRSDGTEQDVDDSRSRHYGVIERTNTGGIVIGNMRAIIKDRHDNLLPAEKIFPESFKPSPAPLGSLEASRFIARHPNRSVQNATSISLIRTIVAQSLVHENQPIYAIVEEPFYGFVRKMGIPSEQISDIKSIPEYDNTENMVLRFIPQEIVDKAKAISSGHRLLSAYFATIVLNDGVGYYDNKLIDPFQEDKS